MKKIIKLKDINIKHSPRVRHEVSKDVVAEYAERYHEKKHGMPDPVLFDVGEMLIVADGMHRITAMQKAGIEAAVFEVHKGSRHDCVRFALQANVKHGKRRTNEDKRQCVVLALEEFPDLSDQLISEAACVNRKMAEEIRTELIAKNIIPAPEKVTGKDGKSYPYKPKPVIDVESTVTETKPKDEKDTGSVPEKKSVSAKDKPEKEIIDCTGYPIPKEIIPLWNERDEAIALLKRVSELRTYYINLAKEERPLFSEIKFSAAIDDLSRLYDSTKVGIPYAVCPLCNGRNPDKCRCCHGKGLVSEFMYRRAPANLLKIREGLCKRPQ